MLLMNNKPRGLCAEPYTEHEAGTIMVRII